jgi:hypothetical protein
MKYYVERQESGYVGNCLLLWRKGGCGYGCDVAEAEVFDDADPHFASIAKDKKYRVWEKDYFDSCASLHVDMQKLNFDLAGIRHNAEHDGRRTRRTDNALVGQENG